MKKVLSLVLVIAMVLSSFSFAFAANFEDVEGDYEEAVNVLTALGVVTGYEDGTFRPERIVTRAEMAKLIVEILGYGDLVSGAKSNFADTQGHWADPWIALAAGRGLVIGTGDGNFTPDRQVSYDEAITMVVRALGYTDDCNELKNMTWPTNFKVKASELDLLDGVKSLAGGADRGGVAQLLFNALNATLVTVTTDGDVTALFDTVDGEKENRILLSRLADKEVLVVNPDHVDPDHRNYKGDVVNLTPYMYQSLNVYVKGDDVVYIKDSNSVVITGTVDSVNTEEGTFVVKDANAKKHTIDLDYAIGDLPMFYNGAEEDDTKIADILKSFESITVVGFEAKGNENDKIDRTNELVGLVVREQTAAKLIANVYRDGRTNLDGIKLPKDGSDVDLDQVTVTGAVDAIEDIEKDDVVVAYAAKDDAKVELVVSRDTVEGRVTRAGSDYAYISGTEYKINTKSTFVADLGERGTFFLDHNGKIVASETTKVEPTDYAVVINEAVGEVGEGRFAGEDFVVDKYPVIKLATQDDEVVIYDVFVEVDEEDGSITDSATYNEDFDLVVTGSGIVLDFHATYKADKAETGPMLVKYILNDDDQIDALEYVALDTLTSVDTTKATFKLADGAVIFDSGDDFAVVKESKLEDKINGWGVYNDDGELEVIITGDVDAEADDAVYAWVEDIELAYNAADEKVQVATVYMNGEEIELYTDDDDVFKVDTDGIYKLELEGNLITKANKVEFTATNVVVEGISTRNDMILLDKWYVVTENATMIILDDGEFDEFVDLYDVAEKDKVSYVLNTDLEIAFFVLTIVEE